MNIEELKDFLETKTSHFNHLSFIESDPIQIPHQYSQTIDIEISAFLTASIAWGRRHTIIKSAFELLQCMDNAPGNFILNFRDSDLDRFTYFKHRTFNFMDCKYFLKALQNIYIKFGSIEDVFTKRYREKQSLKDSIITDFHIYKLP